VREREGGSGREEERQRDYVVVHYVRLVDTLAGIAIRYGVTMEDIKRENHLHDDQIYGKNMLFIPVTSIPDFVSPPPPDDVFKRRVKQFQLRTGCLDEKEAGYYVRETPGWDFERAVERYSEDVAWAKENPMKEDRIVRKGKVSQWEVKERKDRKEREEERKEEKGGRKMGKVRKVLRKWTLRGS